ncbi:MAG: methyltransferase domain-containing protein [Methylicorpusculum sp.]|uniref:methyltransferase domain-containing protein n=1 Tax=Methylicorpusculum sp. TaxID=2713644 RepID=UPI00271A9C98|nr:methyltransferase domain-containing protein [Methylicorpusculum sp.]MDO8937643.1 methyltransferase domain-containing protein [Methylicorpusculum sp.]MDO9242048.1 methyltransferase domain-containing protein [Methylicorpusculum sp.]MDP2201980.1 methyltransferase domain-containing protein [Methylicorpusculum sp.]
MTQAKDRNFDQLIDKFDRKIYQTAKGEWRLKLLKEDLTPFYDASDALTIWDAGCGFAQISLWLAKRGHHLTLCDVSEKMLERAREAFVNEDVAAGFYVESAQTLALKLPQFDVILFHAVLEWLANPLPTLQTVIEQVKPGGHLSLLFYNRNTMVFGNVLKGGWRWKNVLDDSYLGKGSKLTPPNPQYPHDVIDFLENNHFKIITHTGLRVFHDYLNHETLAQSNADELFELESRYCRQPTFRDMGRYVHLVAQRL